MVHPSVERPVERPVHAMGAGVGGAGVGGTGVGGPGTGNGFPVFFDVNLRGRLGTDAAAAGVASMTEAAAAAATCSETKENKASE